MAGWLRPLFYARNGRLERLDRWWWWRLPSVNQRASHRLTDLRLWPNSPPLPAAVRAYGEEAVGRILERVRGMVLRAKEQPEDSKQYGSLQNTTLFGVAAQVRHLPVLLLVSRRLPEFATAA